MGKNKFYILFLYGDLGNTAEFLEYITPIFNPLTDGQFKYVQDKFSAICFFTSEETITEITDYLNYIFQENIHTFILTEKPKSFGVKMSNDLSSHLFDLSKETGYGITLNETVDDPDFLSFHEKEIKKMDQFSDESLEFLTYDEDEEGDEISRIKRNYKPKLRMNSILDKINALGLESLNEDEKKYLSKFSKSD